jgi:PAS domain S-box-containing protein
MRARYESPPTESTGSEAATILVVDDDPATALLERRQLERAGYATLTAATADETLQRLSQHAVDLIVLDYRLPDGEGLDLFERMRSAGHDVPVILVTGHSDEATVIHAFRTGVRDFLPKSARYLDDLPDAVGRVLRQFRTEQQLAESEARLAAIIDSAHEAILITEDDHRLALFNAAAEQMFRCPAAQALGRRLTQFIPMEIVPVPAGPGGGADGAGDGSFTCQVRMGTRGVRADGEEFPLEASASRIEVGGRRYHTVVVRDTTDRNRSEEALRASEERYRSIVDTAGTAILALGVDQRIREWNREAERVSGYTRQEVLGRDYGELFVPAEHRTQIEVAIQAVLAGQPVRGFELPLRRRGGGERLLTWNVTCLHDRRGRAREVVLIGLDITDRKQLEKQLIHAQRMEGIGVLAGGVAHDFNNLLTVILGYSEILLRDLRPEDLAHGLLQEIHKACKRAAGLTGQLLAFGRKQMLTPIVLDLNGLVRELEGMLRSMLGEAIDLKCLPDPDLGQVRADPGPLEQALVNLVVNARDAMPQGGKLTIETHNVLLDQDYLQHHPYVRPGPHVLLAVSDTGCGMDEAVRSRIFEPFFTTKEFGKGTGLGLATVYGIVKQSGGHIEVYSELGHGTTFKIYLPRLPNGSPSTSISGIQLTPAAGSETILLAEDEDALRRLSRLALESSGYQVLEACNGEEALRIFRQHADAIRLLVTDVVMPQMSGRQLADHARALRPDLKVLLLSGYTDDAAVRNGLRESGMPFLHKPFTPVVLGRKVRQVLDQ